jgi:uroporphyrin-III C-methyltransferase
MQSNATVVIYMGMKKTADIAQAYHEAKKGDTPAAIVQHASLPHKKTVKGMVKDLPAMAENAKITHPALIIIGPVVALNII